MGMFLMKTLLLLNALGTHLSRSTKFSSKTLNKRIDCNEIPKATTMVFICLFVFSYGRLHVWFYYTFGFYISQTVRLCVEVFFYIVWNRWLYG
eukprot:m.106179 g.106179  ORF g.106179 m.106179 type:complete len:93 (+) comp27703_c1_seq3:797-1075(+)